MEVYKEYRHFSENDWNALFGKRYNVYLGGRNSGKTIMQRLWMEFYHEDLLTRHLLRRLSAEAILTVSINS